MYYFVRNNASIKPDLIWNGLDVGYCLIFNKWPLTGPKAPDFNRMGLFFIL